MVCPALVCYSALTVLLVVQPPRMAASEGPSHFTVHVFLSHDPSIARVLLPDLFLDFPDSAWKLPPLVEPPQRPREKPVYKSLPRENWSARAVLGRYVFSEPLAGEATLLQLAERVEQEFAIPRKYQGQFTIFPQNQDETGQYPLWDNRPLPWSTTLAEVHQFDLDAFKPGDNGPTAEDAPVLHLVLETKAAALMRIVGPEFLEKEIGEPYRLFVGYWYCLNSFWHFFTRRRQFSSSQLESNLSLWRGARFAYAYLVRQEEKGLSGPYHDELRTSVQKVEELREKERLGGLSDKACWDLNYELRILLSRISHIERNKANGHDQLRHISVFVTQWEDWITNRDFQSLAIRLLEPGEVESKVASVFRQARELVDEWRLSEGRRQLQASIEEEYHAARPWLTEEDRANAERYRLDELERDACPPTPVIWGAANTSTGNSVSPPPEIQAHSMRHTDGTLLSDQSASRFTISSGSLLWGQMICLYSTMSHSDFTQNADAIPPELEGGTILQHRFSYRSAARNGQWKVRPYNERARIGRFLPDPDGPEYPAGWILHHEDVDPGKVLERVRALDGSGPWAVSNRNLHTDKVRPLPLSFESMNVP